MSRQELVKREDSALKKADVGPVTDAVFVPLVDILEGRDELRLRADMPGVDPASVSVSVENDVLTVEGKADCESPAGYSLVGQEFCVGRYRRDFSLGGEVDSEKVKARMRNGVLELVLPKRSEAKTRKIEVES
jgi:HSP20 family protein